MRLVTSCSACHAVFYVSPEQLAAHRGEVRCGRCEQVFNALDRLAEVEPDQPGHAPVAPSSFTAIDAPSQPVEPTFAPPETGPALTSLPEIEIAPEPEPTFTLDVLPEPTSMPLPEVETAFESELEPEPVPEPASMNIVEAPLPWPVIPEPVAEPEPVPAADPVDTIAPRASVLAASVVAPGPTPMDDAARRGQDKPRRSGWLRLLGVLLALLLLLAMLAQTLYYMRSDIAAYWPGLRPYLEQACQIVSCRVTLPGNADLLAIDDSDLQEDAARQGLMYLESTLINRAPYAQRYPELELTLTDRNDKPLLRRTLRPQEYLPAGTSLAAGIAAGQALHIRLPLTADDAPVAGYRLFVTY